MTLDDMMAEWQKDCEIDDLNLDKSSTRSPMLHSKYIQLLMMYRLKLTKVNHDMNALRTAKAKYFRGEMTREELEERGWQQWQYRTLKSDIEQLIDADEEVQKLISRESYIKAAIYFLEQVLQEIKTRSFHIKNIIEFQKFRAGS